MRQCVYLCGALLEGLGLLGGLRCSGGYAGMGVAVMRNVVGGGRRFRTCLRCGQRFMSLSRANRVCDVCKRDQFGACAEAVVLEREELDMLTGRGRVMDFLDAEDFVGRNVVEIAVRVEGGV